MRFSKRLFALLVMMILLVSTVGVGAFAEATKITIDAPITINVLWCQATGESGLETTIEQKMAEAYPNITIQWEFITWEDLPSKMQQYMQSGMPDAVFAKSQDANNFGEYGVWADLTNTSYIADVYESSLVGVTIDGKVLGMPYIGTYGGIYYNRAIFDKYKLKVPTTLAELYTVCDTLKANDLTPFATHFLDTWFVGWELAIVAGGELMSSSETWGNEFRDGTRDATNDDFKAGLDMMEYIYKNTWKDTFSIEQTSCDARFIQGEAAMQMDGSWVAANYASLDPTFDYGLFPFPTTTGNGCLNMEPNITFFKSASTPNSDAVDALMTVMATPDMASAWSQYVGEASLIKGATSFTTPAQSDIDYYSSMGLTRDQNLITNQIPFNAFWAEMTSDFIEYVNGNISYDTVLERSNARRSVCGQ